MTAVHQTERLRLVSDIGGTRARFALSDEQGNLRNLEEFKTSDFVDFDASVRAYLAQLDEKTARPDFAAIAVAGPVEDGVAQLTNISWTIDSREIKNTLGFEFALLVNDFEAQAHALPWLGRDDLEQIGRSKACSNTSRVILGPGTGLGVAGLVPEGRGRFRAVPGEGGHMTLAAMNGEEADLIARLRNRFGHVSAERVLSGPGLEALYMAIAARDEGAGMPEPVTARDMVSRADDGNGAARKTLWHFSCFLGTVAADMALIFWARGGVYLSGGVLKRLGSAFDRRAFRERFESKGRFSDRLVEMPTFLVKHPNVGLLGLAKMPPE